MPIIDVNSDNLVDVGLENPQRGLNMEAFIVSLKNAKNLKKLSITRDWITSISKYLEDELPSIKTLILGANNGSNVNNSLEDLSGIEKMKNLEELNVFNTTKSLNVEKIGKCEKLKYINLRNCNIKDISGLEFLNNSIQIILSNNNISSLKPLENLNNLTELNLENNTISDTASYIDSNGNVKTYNNLEILANLNKNGKLKKLYLSGNDNIVNWTPLSSLNWTEKSGW